MRLLDRYIARQFVFNFLMLGVVVYGLYVLLDLIVNFDEFVQAAQRLPPEAGWVQRLLAMLGSGWEFYWPRLFMLYGYMVGLLPVGAAGFTLAHLIRNRELVAMLAGGVSLYRMAMPIMILGFAANMLLLANQELILPHLAMRISTGRAAIKQEPDEGFRVRFAPDSGGALFTAGSFIVANQTMNQVTILLRRQVQPGIYDRHEQWITATQAAWNAERGGWDLIDGYIVQQAPRPGSPSSPDLSADRAMRAVDFIASDLDPTTILLRERERYRQLLSLRQLAELATRPHLVDVADLIRIRHSRFSLPVINMLILLMGLPYYLLRTPGPLLLPTVRAAILCVPAWAGGFVMHQISPAALSPAAVAWLPVAIYLPIAFYLMDRVET